MRVTYQRCYHCSRKYLYQSSGSYDAEGAEGDSRYCGKCLAVIESALRKVPIVVERRYVASTTHKPEQILDLIEKQKAKNELRIVRIFPPTTGERSDQYMGPEGNFILKWREDNPDAKWVLQEMEIEVATGKVLGKW